MINEQKSILVILRSLTSSFPNVKSWKYIPINYWDKVLRRAPQPLLAMKDAKLLHGLWVFILYFSKFISMFTLYLKAPLTDQFWDTDIMYCYLETA